MRTDFFQGSWPGVVPNPRVETTVALRPWAEENDDEVSVARLERRPTVMQYKAITSIGIITLGLAACSTPNRTHDHSPAFLGAVLTATLGVCSRDLFEKPFRLKTENGRVIDVGDGGGFAGPTLVDLDGDGDRDLVVGQFNYGHFRLYRNIGTEAEPVYAKHEFLRAGNELASVPMG
jgi:hypothetical protein